MEFSESQQRALQEIVKGFTAEECGRLAAFLAKLEALKRKPQRTPTELREMSEAYEDLTDREANAVAGFYQIVMA